mmetsp:Transcript_15454/g.34099  ORF Transcript_15454/g.34099 Transcript_15454/m.34099 type:complete len:247 (-) Transcript_15454:2251-2991(-)
MVGKRLLIRKGSHSGKLSFRHSMHLAPPSHESVKRYPPRLHSRLNIVRRALQHAQHLQTTVAGSGHHAPHCCSSSPNGGGDTADAKQQPLAPPLHALLGLLHYGLTTFNVLQLQGEPRSVTQDLSSMLGRRVPGRKDLHRSNTIHPNCLEDGHLTTNITNLRIRPQLQESGDHLLRPCTGRRDTQRGGALRRLHCVDVAPQLHQLAQTQQRSRIPDHPHVGQAHPVDQSAPPVIHLVHCCLVLHQP